MSFPGFMSGQAGPPYNEDGIQIINDNGNGNDNIFDSHSRNGLLSVKNNNFAYRFLNQLSEKKFSETDGGMIYSPFSIFYIMQLVYMGSSRETKAELSKILGHSEQNQSDSRIIIEMIRIGRQMINTGVFKIANGFFLDKSFDNVISKNFREIMNRVGRIEACNFVQNGSQEVDKINSWVSQNTKGLITKLLSESDVNPDTVLILVNTIYFKANWQHKFKKPATQEQAFQTLNNQRKMVPLMTMKAKTGYFENQNLKILSLNYADTPFAMDFYLPKNLGKNAMKELIETSYKEHVLQLCLYEDSEIEIFIPKFKQRCKNDLNTIFSNFGVQRMFQSNVAEFENMVDSPVGSDDHVYVSKILHEAVVIVDEEGTEAAAATAVMLFRNSAVSIEEKKIFRADHSFLYQIRYLPQHLILFQGIFDGQSAN